MNARDLLTALNDIDPKLLEDTLPWGAPVQKSRRPVWAVAAAIVLCVGLVGGVVLSQNYVPQLANDATGPAQTDLKLEFAENTTGKAVSTSWVIGEEEDKERALTQEELASLSAQAGLSWLEGYLLKGSAVVTPEGEAIWAMVNGYEDEGTLQTGMEAFTLYLQSGEPPQCPVRDSIAFLEEPNNQIGSTGVWAVKAASGVTRGYQDAEGSNVSGQTAAQYSATFLEESGIGVALKVNCDQWGLSEEDAQSLIKQAVSQCLFGGVNLEGLDTASPEPQGTGLKFDADMDSAYEDLSGLLAAYATRHINNQPDTEIVDITPEQLASIWGTPLPWEAYGEVQVEAYSILSQEGEPLFAEATGRLATGEQESVYLFDIQLFPQQPSQEWDALAAAYAQQANNHVNGLDVIAGSFTSTEYNAPQTGPAITYYQAMFCTQGDSPMAANLTVFVHPSSSGESPISGKQAQQLVESLMKPAWDGKLDTSVLGGQAISQEPAGHPEVDLAFTIRASSDKTFSNVWNTFTTLYLEPQNLEAHGVEPDYTLTEEELASLWEDAPPWESFFTENDTVEAYGYFSDEGELIKVFVGGYRDNPETTTQEKCQLFSVALYNKDFTGEWGQDVEAALALADTTVNGVAIATEQTDSTVNYQDGASMDFTDFGALFQPASGPTLVTVDGFANPLGFTEEEAQDFVSKTVGGTLYSGVSLDGVNR